MTVEERGKEEQRGRDRQRRRLTELDEVFRKMGTRSTKNIREEYTVHGIKIISPQGCPNVQEYEMKTLSNVLISKTERFVYIRAVSRSPNSSCEVSCPIGLVITSQLYSSGSSVIKAFVFRVASSMFKSHRCTTFIILLFKSRYSLILRVLEFVLGIVQSLDKNFSLNMPVI